MCKGLILIVEDDNDLLELLEHRLQKEDYETLGFVSTKYVKRVLEEEPIDLILMDRNLPDIEGSEYISLLRDKGMDTPVIFLSAKSSNAHIEEGFLRGGDDYVTKPFELKELLLRIKALLRRTKKDIQKKVASFKDIVLDINLRVAHINGTRVELTKLEFNLLYTFIQNQGSVLKRDFLLEHVWGKDKTTEERTVNVAIKRLKEKIDFNPERSYIKTIRGIGYTIH
ncbi:response regulator transcription factor [Sulfurimonas sp. MAG313]|nr:response regulator transcription factor [Sulfurimonas sp. MAG313]MDF1881448.1 response regulator transcription factor [Sulfurimonas sp. MAG313]